MKIRDSIKIADKLTTEWEKQEVYPFGSIGITNQADGTMCAMLRDMEGRLWMQREIAPPSILSEWTHIPEREETIYQGQSQMLLALHKRDGRLAAIEGPEVRDYWFGSKETEIDHWNSMDVKHSDNLGICERCSGAIELFMADSEHHLWHRWTNLQYDWSEWKALGGWTESNLAVVNNQEGFPQVLVRGEDQAIWVIRHYDTGMWSNWFSLGGKFTGRHAAISGADGMISVVAAGVDGNVYLCQQKETLDQWKCWVKLGHFSGKEIVLFYNKEQDLMVVVLDEQGNVWSRAADSKALEWEQLGESIRHVQCGSLSNGETVLFGVKSDGCLYQLLFASMK